MPTMQFSPAKGDHVTFSAVTPWVTVGSYYLHTAADMPTYIAEMLRHKAVLMTTLGSLTGDGLTAYLHIMYRLDRSDPKYPQGAIDQETFIAVFNGTVLLTAGYVHHAAWCGRTTDLSKDSPYRHQVTSTGTVWSSDALPQASCGPLSAITDISAGSAFAASYALAIEHARKMGSWR